MHTTYAYQYFHLILTRKKGYKSYLLIKQQTRFWALEKNSVNNLNI